jgi:UDP-N-acetylglucosamine 2-epimerase (non-hydrolysing)
MAIDMKILSVVGARPNFVKIAPIIDELNKRSIENVLVHTGQHYDNVMSEEFFGDLGLPEPDINLEVGSASHADQTAKIMSAFERVLVEEKPDVMIVVGDVNSTLACSVVASKIDYGRANRIVGNNSMMRPLICHVEAGLRSFDRTMPEEINRIVTDALSDILFVTEESGRINLLRESKNESQIHFVGNVMIDSLLRHKKLAKEKVTCFKTIKEGEYGLITLHRPSNVDDRETLGGILEALRKISRKVPLLFPMHPRTGKQVQKFELTNFFRAFETPEDIDMEEGIYVMPPLTYLEFLSLMMDAPWGTLYYNKGEYGKACNRGTGHKYCGRCKVQSHFRGRYAGIGRNPQGGKDPEILGWQGRGKDSRCLDGIGDVTRRVRNSPPQTQYWPSFADEVRAVMCAQKARNGRSKWLKVLEHAWHSRSKHFIHGVKKGGSRYG